MAAEVIFKKQKQTGGVGWSDRLIGERAVEQRRGKLTVGRGEAR